MLRLRLVWVWETGCGLRRQERAHVALANGAECDVELLDFVGPADQCRPAVGSESVSRFGGGGHRDVCLASRYDPPRPASMGARESRRSLAPGGRTVASTGAPAGSR